MVQWARAMRLALTAGLPLMASVRPAALVEARHGRPADGSYGALVVTGRAATLLGRYDADGQAVVDAWARRSGGAAGPGSLLLVPETRSCPPGREVPVTSEYLLTDKE